MTFIESVQFWAAKAVFELGILVGLLGLLALYIYILDRKSK